MIKHVLIDCLVGWWGTGALDGWRQKWMGELVLWLDQPCSSQPLAVQLHTIPPLMKSDALPFSHTTFSIVRYLFSSSTVVLECDAGYARWYACQTHPANQSPTKVSRATVLIGQNAEG